jgi:hypothetical protein
MKNSNSSDPQPSPVSAPAEIMGFSPWQRLKSKRISYLTIPLIVMATVTEFVILATGWKYQQVVCLPKGMGVTFFGIGPIGATILAVELLKLPLAIWTASRQGWQKKMMLVVGLPVICLLTFQLVKDMAVYEMGVALTPASQMLEQADKEETKIAQLKGELAAIETKKTDRDHKLAELTATKAKAGADLEESLKRNNESRQDAISLTDYQKQQLSEVQSREANLIKQFDADTEQLTKAIAELRAHRQTELPLATKWNAEQARIDNAYNAKMAAYTNQKAKYEKDKVEYDHATYLKRLLTMEPFDPGVPPVREDNTFLKPLVADIETQISTKEAELLAVNNKRRDAVAQVEADAHRLRGEFDSRSITKREETDHKRTELLAAQAALDTQWTAEQKQINQEFQDSSQKIDGINAEIDTCTKNAEGFYETREASIKNTQVYRIATTVEIVRGLLMGQRPVSIKATARERGDLYTDQISMVRIWVYPVLAFIVAFLPTLLVEIGFSTIFHPEKQRPPYRIGFFGRRLHWLYTRAGRQKILRAERIAREATARIAERDKAVALANSAAEEAVTIAGNDVEQAVAAANAAVQKARADKEAGLQAAQDAILAAAAENAEQLRKNKDEWAHKLAGMADSLNRTVIEKDALRDLQKSEIERQIQMRQNAWSDRVTQLRQELDDQRTAAETERTALIQEHHQKLMEVSEESKIQVFQARRAMADAEFAGVEKVAGLSHDLKQALHARDEAESQLKHQADSLSLKLAQAQEDAARDIEKAGRQEKHRLERQQLDFEKVLRQREEDLEHRLKKNEQELSAAFDARLLEEKTRAEQEGRRREAELERQSEARIREQETRWHQEIQQLEAAAQARLQERDQQLQAQAEVRLSDVQAQAEQALKRRESEFERQLEVQSREAETRLRQELQQMELAFHTKLKQREKELTALVATRETELQNQWAADLRAREEEFERQAEVRARATETRLGYEAQQKEEAFKLSLRQREHQLQSQFDARQAELQTQWEQNRHGQEQEWERNAEARTRATESRWTAELQQKEELFQSKLRQRDEQWQAKLGSVRAELLAKSEQELRRHDAELAEAGLRASAELESKLRQEMQQKDEVAEARATHREQDLVTQLAAQAEAHRAAQAQWETESKEKIRTTTEHFKALQDRIEKECEDAKAVASERLRRVQNLEKKLTEASLFLNGWKNGKHLVELEPAR